tara:strand:- start:5025 stop:5537 length:513 start_codon:yes stop_codon:yes gene_type:complete
MADPIRATSKYYEVPNETEVRNTTVFKVLRKFNTVCNQVLMEIDPNWKKYATKIVDQKWNDSEVSLRAPLLKEWRVQLGKKDCYCQKTRCKQYFLKDRIKQSPKVNDQTYHTKGKLKNLFPAGWKTSLKLQLDLWKKEPFDYWDYEDLWELDRSEAILLEVSDYIRNEER